MAAGCFEPWVLDRLARGSADEREWSDHEAHLDACPECARLLGELARIYGSSIASRAASGVSDGADARARSAPLTLGRVRITPPPAPPEVGRYRLEARLGAGAMGIVFAAHDPELDRRVAIKLLHPDALGDADRQRARLVREARAMAKLAHPNVVSVYDCGRFGEQVFVACELIDGTTLGGWLRARPRGRAEIVAMMIGAGRGLAAAHAAGLAHRDFKPENVLIGRDERARVTDFGLARTLDEERTLEAALSRLESRPSGGPALIGTPAYMAPEQLRGEPADARTDQFAFCVVLHEALFGARPFEGDHLGALAGAVLAGRRRALPATTPRWLRALLARGLATRPEDRFADMDALLAELGRERREGRRRVAIAAAIVLTTAIAAGGIALARRPQTPSDRTASSAFVPARADPSALPPPVATDVAPPLASGLPGTMIPRAPSLPVAPSSASSASSKGTASAGSSGPAATPAIAPPPATSRGAPLGVAACDEYLRRFEEWGRCSGDWSAEASTMRENWRGMLARGVPREQVSAICQRSLDQVLASPHYAKCRAKAQRAAP